MNEAVEKKREKTIFEKLKRWVYVPKILDGGAILSDGTRYQVDGVTGAWKRVTPKSVPRRERQRFYGKTRRNLGMTRSQFDKYNVELAAEAV